MITNVSDFLKNSIACACSYRAFWVGSPLTDGLFCQRIWQPLKTFPLQRPMEYLSSMPAVTEPLVCQFFQSQKMVYVYDKIGFKCRRLKNKWDLYTYVHDSREKKKIYQYWLPNKNNQLFLSLYFSSYFSYLLTRCVLGWCLLLLIINEKITNTRRATSFVFDLFWWWRLMSSAATRNIIITVLESSSIVML